MGRDARRYAGLPPKRRQRRAGGARLLRQLLRSRWLVVVGAVLVGLAWRAGLVVVPILVQVAVDEGITGQDPAALRGATLALAAVGIVTAVLTGVRHELAGILGYGAEAHLRAHLLDHLGRLTPDQHEVHGQGRLLGNLTADLEAIEPVPEAVPTNVANLVFIGVVGTLLATRHPELAVVAVVPLTLLVVVASLLVPRLRRAGADLQAALGEVTAESEQTVLGIRVVKGLGAEEVRTARVRDAANRA
ncbi:MAG: ABC transporter transmembrane domain-containing protein, partial [Nitriliruptoraceae bacterium]